MHRCSYAHEFDTLPEEVRETLEDRSYDAFVGPAVAGGVTPLNDAVTPARTIAAVPNPLAATVDRLLSTASFSRYTSGNHELSERVAHEAVAWCGEQWAKLTGTDSLAGEEEDLRRLRESSTVEEAGSHLPPPERARLRGFAEDVLRPDMATGPGVEARARIAVVAERWDAELGRERETYQARELGRALGSFVRELSEVIPELSRVQSLVRDIFGSEDALWDLDHGAWETVSWAALEEYAGLLDDLPELQRLAEILGRSRVVTEQQTVTRRVQDVSVRPEGMGKSEVTGVSFGDDVSSLLASEVALLADPDTEDLFYAKLAHKELLQLDYRREKLVRHVHERIIRTTGSVTIPRGPVIACVDTSGSMLGEPERVAKAMALALAGRLGADGRDLQIISFSTEARTITLSATEVGLADLCEFLSGGFHGGTDLRPALDASLTALETSQFQHADVLVISDFRIPKIADRFIERIKAQQDRGTLFHSLTIARGAVRDPLHIFDNSWLFDVGDGARGIRPDTLRFLG